MFVEDKRAHFMCLNLSWPHSFSKTVWVLCIFILHALWSQCAQLQNWRLQHINLQFPKLKKYCNFLYISTKIKGHQELEQNRNLQIVCINTSIKYVQLKAPAEWANTVNDYFGLSLIYCISSIYFFFNISLKITSKRIIRVVV